VPERIELVRHVCLLGLAVACVYTDLAWGKIYNLATLPALVLGLILALLLDAAGPGYPRLIAALAAAALAAGLLLLPYLVGGMGAGDVKLMAAVGALGPGVAFAVTAVVFSAITGFAIAIGVLIWKGRLLQGLKDSARALVTFKAKPREGAEPVTVPYGVAIGIGTLWAWLEHVQHFVQ